MAAENTNIKISLPRSDLKALKDIAKERGVSFFFVLRTAVRNIVENPDLIPQQDTIHDV